MDPCFAISQRFVSAYAVRLVDDDVSCGLLPLPPPLRERRRFRAGCDFNTVCRKLNSVTAGTYRRDV
jgi:hypothetical protein